MIAVSGHATADCESQGKEADKICKSASEICDKTPAGSEKCTDAEEKCFKALIDYEESCGSANGE